MGYINYLNDIDRIFIDLDEVLVDFVGPAYDLICGETKNPDVRDYVKFLYLFNRDIDYRKQGFSKIGDQGPDWWANLPKLPWADELLATCKSVCDDVCILTAPGPLPSAAAGKLQWAMTNGLRHNIIITSIKTRLASPGALLIDDRDKYVIPWEEAGGRAIQVNREWSTGGMRPDKIIETLNLHMK